MSPATLDTVVGSVGPQDVDAPGELAPKVVKQMQAHELISKVRANYPAELVVLEQRDEDRPRTAALDSEEVAKATVAAFGDEKADGGVAKVESARVRGKAQPPSEKFVCVLWQTPSGRTARGAIPYAELTVSQDAFAAKVTAGDITDVDEKDAEDLKRTVERQQETIQRLNQRLASQSDTLGGDPDKVPTGTVKELKAGMGEFSTEQLNALLEAERADEAPRSSLIKAAEAELNSRGG